MTEPATQSQANVGPETSANRRRGGRACDTCRRAKVRCEPLPNSTTCQACHTAGIECLYTGPNFKRGPPKGYIQALEQRWYRCETLLAAITTSRNPYALAIVQLLHQDELAREVLDSVNNGPFGPAGRAALSASATLDEVFHYLTTNSVPTAGSSSRPEKRSRVSREAVSNETATMSFKELGWWEDRLSTILASAELQNASEYAPESSSQQQGSHAGDPDISGSLDMSQLYSMFPASEEGTSDSEVDEAVDAFGHLSVDETQELRYHGNVSGYPLLSGEDRWDDRNEGGVWKFPMARVWPSAVEGRHNYPQEEDIDIQMPPREQQEPLIKTYFTYIHPCFPLIDKPQFIKQFKAGFEGECTQGPRTKTLSKVLLLSVLAIAERYATSKENTPPEGVMSELGCDFAATAHEIVGMSVRSGRCAYYIHRAIAKTMHHSHPVICQSLLIMGVREFSLGSTEQAWLYTGMAIRMAYDLGLNWDPANWKFKGEDLFSNKDKQIRRTIWWSLCIVDRHLSAFLGVRLLD
ncbi:hypothetical protein OE88DRAFT_338975 [Heliocybe sulcata]|uniref:Zn(2)-C6 fungal-type domain-containing protein n=1 Tax=Heliocybe sulcata TaxID=5364 RepID=A0A5C3MYX3_9AGAM|nr:hypothetical protein OE88DRAFT_338975 [Heliocybe sulcata]